MRLRFPPYAFHPPNATEGTLVNKIAFSGAKSAPAPAVRRRRSNSFHSAVISSRPSKFAVTGICHSRGSVHITDTVHTHTHTHISTSTRIRSTLHESNNGITRRRTEAISLYRIYHGGYLDGYSGVLSAGTSSFFVRVLVRFRVQV